jgi:hypothetical protein
MVEINILRKASTSPLAPLPQREGKMKGSNDVLLSLWERGDREERSN